MWLKQVNNWKWNILWTILAGATNVTIKDSKGGLFPSTFPYRCTITKFVNNAVTQREIVEVTNRVSDTFTITRGAEACPSSDTATSQTTTAFQFDDNDSFQLSRTAEKDDEFVDLTTYNLEKNVFSASTEGDDDYVITDSSLTSYNNWQPIRFSCDVANTWSATLEINALWPKVLKKNQWTEDLVTWDILADWIVTAVYNSTLNVFQFSWQIATEIIIASKNLKDTFTAWEDLDKWDIFELISNSISYWTENAFAVTNANEISVTQIDTDKVFIAYQDATDSQKWKWIVWTITWNTISYWSIVTFETATALSIKCVKIDTDKVFIAYRWFVWSANWTWIVATISWTVPSYGWKATFHSASITNVYLTQLTTDKVFMQYYSWTDLTSKVATISGTTPSYGSWTIINPWNNVYNSATLIDTDKVFIAFSDIWNSDHWTWIIATISGTSISKWAEYVFNSANTDFISVTKIDTDKVFIWYYEVTGTDWTWIVATVSGTVISYWSPVIFNSSASTEIFCTQIDTDKAVVWYTESSVWKSNLVTISWTVISYWVEITFNNSNTWVKFMDLIDTDKFFIAFRDTWTSNNWQWIVWESSFWETCRKAGSLISDKISWVVDTTTTKGNTFVWTVDWISDNHTWLQPWKKHYLSDTPWEISITPWSNTIKVWNTNSDTDLHLQVQLADSLL